MVPLSSVPFFGRHGANPPLQSLQRTTYLESSSLSSTLSLQSAFVLQRQQQQQQQQPPPPEPHRQCSVLKETTATAALSSLSSSKEENVSSRKNTFARTWSASLLLVATAVVYAAVLRHPKCVLTNVSAVTMLLYAFQTSLQPRLSRQYLDPQSNKQSVALVEELVKTVLATILYVATGRSSTWASSGWTLSSSLWTAALPAALYAIQGVLTYTAYPHLDAVTFNGLSQTKTVSAAFFCWLLLGQTQTLRQTTSIAILITSAIVFRRGSGSANGSPKTTNRRAIQWLGKGVLPCLGAMAVSGCAGALSQRGLQVVHRDPYLFTIEVSIYSALCLLLSLSQNRTQQQPWTWPTPRALIPVTFKALGGILTALVHKHAGSVLKGFALVLGLVLSGLFQTAMDQEELTMPQVTGSLLVLLSSWMQFTPQG